LRWAEEAGYLMLGKDTENGEVLGEDVEIETTCPRSHLTAPGLFPHSHDGNASPLSDRRPGFFFLCTSFKD